MNPVLLKILVIFLWIVAVSCGCVVAVLYIMNDYTSLVDRVGGVGLIAGGLAYFLTPPPPFTR